MQLLSCSPLNSPLKSLGQWESRTNLQTTHRSKSLPLSLKTILVAYPVREMRIKKAVFSHGLYYCWSILFFFDLLPTYTVEFGIQNGFVEVNSVLENQTS